LKARFLPIISMLEGIRRQVMVRIHENRNKAERWTSLICPNTYKKLMTYITASGFYQVISNGNNCYEVTYWDHRFTVNLDERTCSCRFWQLSGLPCPHAISCIYYCGGMPPDILMTRHGPHHRRWPGPQDQGMHGAARRAPQDIV